MEKRFGDWIMDSSTPMNRKLNHHISSNDWKSSKPTKQNGYEDIMFENTGFGFSTMKTAKPQNHIINPYKEINSR